MNIEKFYQQDISTQISKACKFGWRLHFLARDLRTFANAVGTTNLEELEKYCYYKQHFNGGFAASPELLVSNNENYNNWNFCIRETQSYVLNTSYRKGNLGADLITGKALHRMLLLGKSGLTKSDFEKEEGEFHCEHNFQVNHIAKLSLAKIFNGQIDPISLVRFIIDHSLIVTVLKSERNDKGSKINENIAPFWRYADVGATVLQFTDDGIENVTAASIQEINSNRWTRNKYFRDFRTALDNLDKEILEKAKEEAYKDNYMKEPCSSTSPILDKTNLEILVKNDSKEIASKFYPDKFKDRWIKK